MPTPVGVQDAERGADDLGADAVAGDEADEVFSAAHGGSLSLRVVKVWVEVWLGAGTMQGGTG